MATTILGSLKLTPSPPPSVAAGASATPGRSSLYFHLANAGAAALVAASLLVADPALAFKGGGPYGQQVTRGQDLTGKDFSGQTLIRQDFKTSILRQANFKGAKLLGASFFDADLTGADLSDADLRGADFSLANVTKGSSRIILQILQMFHSETINENTSAKLLMGSIQPLETPQRRLFSASEEQYL
uniref:Uncharacterized protein n=1 Tax=Oryza brachyantha TaxID=4533 RepID=J3KWD1_ORYBR